MTGIVRSAALQPQQLRCEYLAEPLGIDVASPRLSWMLAPPGDAAEPGASRGLQQSGYQVLVASTPELLANDDGDLWDSGAVASGSSSFIGYEGRPLVSRQVCYWKVRARVGTHWGPWSGTARWSMGLLDPADWSAAWIGSPAAAVVEPAPMLRKAFELEGGIKRATLYVSGLGYYECWINGRRVGDRLLDPKVTRYDRRVLYATYDVAEQVVRGINAVGVMLGNGWYHYHVKNPWHFDEAPWRAKPKLWLQLEVEYADGSMRTVVSDGTWRHATGPVQYDGMLNGEWYDARLERPGWNTPGYDDSGWAPAAVVDAPQGRLSAQMIQPIRVVDVLKPVKLTEPEPGVFVGHFGQNIAGAARLTVSGPAGTRIRIRYAELLHADGTIDQTNINTFCESGEFQTEYYTLKGEGLETWQARFMYYGFQYVELTGFPGEPTLDNLAGLVIHSDVGDCGGFECSNELLNRIHHCNRWSFLNNFHGYPTDCPNREKIGWTGDAHIAGETGLYNFDVSAIYAAWLLDFEDEQGPRGELPGIVPTGGWGYDRWGGPAWCSALILLPWYMYRHRGDLGIVARHYAGMKRYVDYLTAESPGRINGQGMGDWFPSKTETPVEITSTSYYYIDALVLAEMAGLLGKPDDAAKYGRLAGEIKDAFNARFFAAETAQYGGGAQTANSCAVYQGLTTAENHAAVVRNLADSVVANDHHLDCGILGAKYILHALADHGHAELAYALAAQSTWPSWGDMVRQGATTLWEGWNADIGTHNHVMLGDISAWFYATLAGIRCDTRQPGFKHVIIRPQPARDLDWVKAWHDSPHGRIISHWRREDRRFVMDVTIPVNATATVHVPARDISGVTEAGQPARFSPGVEFLRMDAGAAVFTVGSGAYRFVSTGGC